MLSKPMRNRLCFGYVSLVVCIAIGFLYRIVFKLLLNIHFFRPSGQKSFSFIDYVAFYSAGKIVLSDTRAQIYQFATQLAAYNKTLTESLGAKISVDHIPLGQSVPWFFAMVAPFSLMPILFSYIAWCLTGLALSGFWLWKILKQNGYTTLFSVVFLLGVAGSFPYEHLMDDGQNSAFILAALAFMLYSWFRGGDVACGIGLALMSIKPQYAVFLVIPAIAMRRWRVLVSAAASGAVLLIASALIFSVKTLVDYPALLHQTEKTDPAVFPTWMVSIRGPLSILMDLDLALNISTITFALAFLALLGFWLRFVAKGSQTKIRIAIAITLLVCMLTSPHTHIYDLVIFAAAVAVVPMKSFFETTGLPAAAVVWSRVMVLYPLISFCIYLLTEIPAFIPFGHEILGVGFFILNCSLLAILIWYYRSVHLMPITSPAEPPKNDSLSNETSSS
jgi:hypothetical protein